MKREYLDYSKRQKMTEYLMGRAAAAGKPITMAFVVSPARSSTSP